MRILVTGAKGMLAYSLIPILKEKHTVIPLSRKELDITERHHVYKTLKDALPDIVINCAAYTKVDKAEEERDKAFLINGTGVQNLALACADRRIPLVHISTDYVFDGEKRTPYTPFDIPNPISVYGQSKLAGERYIQWITNKFYIIRTSWLYGEGGNNFVLAILRKAREQTTIRVVKDQIGSPTYTASLSNSIKKLIESGAYGIYHITDDTGGGISWFDFAKEIISLSGLNTEVIPIPTEEFPTPAKRPRYSVLDIQMTRLALKTKLPFWKDELQKFLTTAPST
jgi:dTDP-4-dehydrorhamnose reductase